jgi:FMN reductase
MTTIVGIGGSLAVHSVSLATLWSSLEGAEATGARTVRLSVRDLDLPFFRPDVDGMPANAARLLDESYRADGLIWSSPMYNGTVSGAVKNALDWFHLLGDREPPYLTDKVIGLISTAGGTQGLQVVNTMQYVVRSLRAWAVPLVVPMSGVPQDWDGEGTPFDETIGKQLRMLGAEVARVAELFAAGELDDAAEQCAAAAARVAAAGEGAPSAAG